MAFYFSNIPDINYPSQLPNSKIGDYIKVKNFFRKGKIRDEIFGNLQYFTKYKIIGDERPDNVSYKIYGDEKYDYVIMLSNNFMNVQDEWPLSQETFDTVMLEKYGSYEALYGNIHHYETQEIRNSFGVLVIKSGIKMQPNWKTNGNFIEAISAAITNITATENGNQITPSKTVTVFMENEIPANVGDQVTIDGVSENQYNGKFIITSISGSWFTYELPEIPNVINPIISSSRKEQVIYTIQSNSLNTGNSYYYEYWDPGLGYSPLVPSTSFLKPVTNYEYEINLEEKKREIYVLRPDYLAIILEDLEKTGTYKKGGSQFVDSRTKIAN